MPRQSLLLQQLPPHGSLGRSGLQVRMRQLPELKPRLRSHRFLGIGSAATLARRRRDAGRALPSHETAQVLREEGGNASPQQVDRRRLGDSARALA